MEPAVLIKDKDFQKPLKELGFCITQLFSDEQIAALQKLYQSSAIENNVAGLYSNHRVSPLEHTEYVSREIFKIISPALENAFEGYECFISHFMVKEAETSNEFALHQDWNILEESEFTNYQVWFPLEMAYPLNGGMFVLPGSHRFFNNYRSGSYDIPKVPTNDELQPLITDMIVAPGQALIYHNSLFHGSYPNKSGKNRVAVIASIRQKGAPLYYFHKNKVNNTTEKFPITASSLFKALPILEKGGVPDYYINPLVAAVDPVKNEEIASAHLIAKFREAFGPDEKAFEPIQLHILKDRELEKKMERDGYAVIDFIDRKTVDEIKTEYLKNFGEHSTNAGRFTTMEHTSVEMKQQMHNFIIDKTRPFTEKFFIDYQIPIATYFTKYARSAGDLTWHTDTSLLLNAHLEPHYALWCPVIDVNEKNGVLCVIEGSHKLPHRIYLNDLPWPYKGFSNLFDKQKKVFELKAGQAVLFDIKLVHHATPNDSGEDRICFSFRITHKKTAYFSFSIENKAEDTISIFRENPDYYLKADWRAAPILTEVKHKVGEIKNMPLDVQKLVIEEASRKIPAN